MTNQVTWKGGDRIKCCNYTGEGIFNSMKNTNTMQYSHYTCSQQT